VERRAFGRSTNSVVCTLGAGGSFSRLDYATENYPGSSDGDSGRRQASLMSESARERAAAVGAAQSGGKAAPKSIPSERFYVLESGIRSTGIWSADIAT